MDAWTGGRTVVELLKAEGVRHIFGIVGATFLDVLDALYDDRSVEYVNVRHEQAAAFMADGLARVTDRPGVCLVTSGPGATNLVTGVAAAYVAHSPVVLLVGGIALDHYQKDYYAKFSPDKLTPFPVLVPTDKRFSHVARGGSWSDEPNKMRSAARTGSDKEWIKHDPQRPQSIWWLTKWDVVGFRVVRAVDEQDNLKGLRSKVTKESD